jgi:hypothetical protein
MRCAVVPASTERMCQLGVPRGSERLAWESDQSLPRDSDGAGRAASRRRPRMASLRGRLTRRRSPPQFVDAVLYGLPLPIGRRPLVASVVPLRVRPDPRRSSDGADMDTPYVTKPPHAPLCMVCQPFPPARPAPLVPPLPPGPPAPSPPPPGPADAAGASAPPRVALHLPGAYPSRPCPGWPFTAGARCDPPRTSQNEESPYGVPTDG